MTVQRTVILYGKPDCHLCHEAEAMLAGLTQEYGLRVEKVSIVDDEELESKYRYAIPVIVLDDGLELGAPISERELRAALRRS